MISSKQLKIMQWNANSIFPKLQEFILVLKEYDIDIACLSETKLNNSVYLKIPGYKIYRVDRNRHGGGVAIVIKCTIQHNLLDLQNTSCFESIGISLQSCVGVLHILSVYKPPQMKLNSHDLNTLTRYRDVYVFGDFNARNIIWNCSNTTAPGKLLHNYCLQKNIRIIAPDEPTFYSSNPRYKPSTIDLLLAKNSKYYESTQVLPIMNSNHNPVVTKLNFSADYDNSSIEVLDYSKTNWQYFDEFMDYNLDLSIPMNSPDDINTAALHFANVISQAVQNSVPKKRIITSGSPNYSYLHSHVLNYVLKIKNHYRRKFQRTRNNFFKKMMNFFVKLIPKLIAALKNISWSKKLKNVKGPNSLWKVKRMVKKTGHIPALQVDPNTSVYSDTDKAELLGKHFQSVHEANLLHSIPRFQKHIESRVKDFAMNQIMVESDIEQCDSLELLRVVKKLKCKKSPGIDGISNLVIKKLNLRSLHFLSTIINKMFLHKHFPESWKCAKVVSIHKAGKPSNLASSYRPISLLSGISKLAEKVILTRMQNFMSTSGIIMPEQFGFRKSHSTTGQVARVADMVIDGFNLKKHTGMVTLDLEKSFDCVWHDGLIFKMIKIGFPTYLIFIVMSYLKNRFFQVFVNQAYSSRKYVAAGVPQGSLMGPVMFILYLYDMPKFKHVHRAIYADDTALYVSSWRTDTIQNRLRDAFRQLDNYFKKWKIKINKNKTELILFTRRRPIMPKALELMGCEVPYSKHVKYLGVHLDSKLLLNHNLKFLRDKFFIGLKSIYPIFNKRSPLNIKNKLTLYKSCLRPIITYACPLFNIMSKTNLSKLQVLQNIALRIIGNYENSTKISRMHQELNIEYIHAYINRLSINFFQNLSENKNSALNELNSSCLDQFLVKYKKIKYRRLKQFML